MAWGLSLAGGMGVVLAGGCLLFTLTWQCFTFEDPISPWCGCVFLVLNSFGVGLFGLLSQNKKSKKCIYLAAS